MIHDFTSFAEGFAEGVLTCVGVGTYFLMDGRFAKYMQRYDREYCSIDELEKARSGLKKEHVIGPFTRSTKKRLLKDMDRTYQELLAKEDVSSLPVEEQARKITFSDPTPEELERYRQREGKIRFGAV